MSDKILHNEIDELVITYGLTSFFEEVARVLGVKSWDQFEAMTVCENNAVQALEHKHKAIILDHMAETIATLASTLAVDVDAV